MPSLVKKFRVEAGFLCITRTQIYPAEDRVNNLPSFCLSIHLSKFDRQRSSSKVIAILDLISGSPTLFTEKW